MQGFQLEFFMEQNQRIGSKAQYEWLLDKARELGIGGATVLMGAMGYGHNGRIHSAHFFDLADQPVLVTMVVRESEAQKIFEALDQVKANMFYVKIPVEYGSIGVPVSSGT